MARVFVEAGTSAADVNEVIEAASSGDVIIFEAGTHVFDQSIFIQRDDITLRGSGSSQTHIKFRFDQNEDGIIDVDEGANGFDIRGFDQTQIYVPKAERTTVETAFEAGETTINVADTSNITVGDTLYIGQRNTDAYLDEIGGCEEGTACRESALSGTRAFREFITKVTAIDEASGTITLEEGIPYGMDPAELPINVSEIRDVASGIELSGLSIEFEVFDPETGEAITPDPNDFSNTQDGFTHGDRPTFAAISVAAADDIELNNLSIINAPSHGISLISSTDVTSSNVRIDGSFNKGAGGNGYGLNITESYGNDFTDLTVNNVRHSVLFSAWSSETDNSIHVRSTNRDINFHGGPDRDNSVIVDRAFLSYGDAEQSWALVSNGGRLIHQQTDIEGFGNEVLLGLGVGADRDDVLRAQDDGGVLVGRNGDDVLYGGAGADRLIGGNGDDIIYVGGGDDVILGGGGRDTVTYETSASRVWADLRGNVENRYGAEGDEFTSIENLIGSSFNDLLLGDDRNNVLDGDAGNDVLFGRSGHDIITGGSGDDELHGQRGGDTLTGGDGADVFFFESGSGRDIITDFENGVDLIDFSRIESVNSFDDLTLLEKEGANTAIIFLDDDGLSSRAVVLNTDPTQFDSSDFVFG